VTSLEDNYDRTMEELAEALNKVTALENELDAAHAALKDATSSHKGTSSEPTTGTGAGEAAAALEAAEHQRARLAQQNEELQAKVSNLQAQMSCRRILGHAPSDSEVAESEALVAELMALQRGSSGPSSGGSAAAAAAAAVSAVDGERQVAENTLAALTERNRRLTEESSAAARQGEQLKDLEQKNAALMQELEALRTKTDSQSKKEDGRLYRKFVARIEGLEEDLRESSGKNSALAYSVKILQDQLAEAESYRLENVRLAGRVDTLKRDLADLVETKGTTIDASAIREAQEEAREAKKRAFELQMQLDEMRAGRQDAQRSLDSLAKKIPGLEAAIARLEAENAQLTESSARGAAVVGEQLAQQQQRWDTDRRQLEAELGTASSRASQLAEENEGLIAQLQQLIPPPERAGNNTASLSFTTREASAAKVGGGAGNVSLVQELQAEINKLETENKRIAQTAKELLAEKGDLLDRLTNVALDSGFGQDGQATPQTGSPRQDLAASRLRGSPRLSSPTAYTEKESMSLPGSPGSDVSGHRRTFSTPGASPLQNAAGAGADGDATPAVQQGPTKPAGTAAPLTATQRLRALYSQLDDDDEDSAVEQGQERPALDRAALRRKHAAQAAAIRQLEGTQQDAQRRAALKQRANTVLMSYDKVKAEAVARLDGASMQRAGTDNPRSEGGRATPETGNVGHSSSSRRDPDGTPVLRRVSEAPLSNRRYSGPALEPPSPTGSVASSHSGTPSLGSARAMAVRYEAAEAAAAATAAQMAGLEKPPRPLGHSRTTSASESASSLADVRTGSFQRHSGDGAASDAGSRLHDGNPAVPQQRPEVFEGLRTSDRRARQEMEQTAYLRQHADAKVNVAFSRWAGGQDSSPDVGSFMRALGWRSFKSDPLTHPVALFETALRITHPSRGLGGSAKDKAIAAATHAKLQEWQAAVLG